MIALSSSVRKKQFSQEDLELLESLASAAVLRVRNVALTKKILDRRVLVRELELAHEIQMSMLPRNRPARPEVELGAALRPARSVGGDLYDFVLDGDHLWFSVADVSDKGVGAALYMAVAKTLFRAFLNDDARLTEVVNGMNRELCRDNDQMMFITALVGCLTLTTGEVALIDAGHNPSIVIDPKGQVTFPPIAKNVALGVVPDATYVETTLTLANGATLVL